LLNPNLSGLSKSTSFYSTLSFLAFLLAFVVILLGAYTRLTNAGLSCPDWPRCYGYLTPPLTTPQIEAATKAYPQIPLDKTRAWTEMRHRYLAGLEGLLIVTLITLSWYWRKELPPLVFKLSQPLILILLGQVILGKLTVTALLKPVIVLGHLLLGFFLMSLLWIICLLTRKPLVFSARQHLSLWVSLGLGILILQIALGGWVSTHSAGLACIDFPYCKGSFLPALQWNAFDTDLITIQMMHRLGALFTLFYLSLLSLFLLLQKSSRRFGLLLLSLLVTQMLLGILNILWLRPLFIALSHHAVAALLLLTLLATLVHTPQQGHKPCIK